MGPFSSEGATAGLSLRAVRYTPHVEQPHAWSMRCKAQIAGGGHGGLLLGGYRCRVGAPRCGQEPLLARSAVATLPSACTTAQMTAQPPSSAVRSALIMDKRVLRRPTRASGVHAPRHGAGRPGQGTW